MTNNPTIDGVSRQLLERIVKDQCVSVAIVEQLRALLDADIQASVAPAVERQDASVNWQAVATEQMGIIEQRQSTIAQLQARVQDLAELAYIGEHEFPELTWKSRCEELRNRIAELESGRGEPVAWSVQCVHPRAGRQSALFDKKYQAENWATHWREACGLESSFEPLYAAPPAPAAVMLPDRKPVTVSLLSESNTHNRGWNACLDATAALNNKNK